MAVSVVGLPRLLLVDAVSSALDRSTNAARPLLLHRRGREDEDLKGGAVLKGTVQAGQGEERPQEGDLVFLHYSLQSEHGDVLLSTRAEHGGAGRPQPFVLGRGRRMLRGMELGVTGARGCCCFPASACACAAAASAPDCFSNAPSPCRDGAGGARAAGHQALLRLPARRQRAAAAAGPARRGARHGRRHSERRPLQTTAVVSALLLASDGASCRPHAHAKPSPFPKPLPLSPAADALVQRRRHQVRGRRQRLLPAHAAGGAGRLGVAAAAV